MTDLAARTTDRQHRAGLVADPARRVAQRLRSLELTREAVELAAWCGLGGSRTCSATGDGEHWATVDNVLTPESWARGLAPLLVAGLDRKQLTKVLIAVQKAAFLANGSALTINPGDVAAFLVRAARVLGGPRLRSVVAEAVARELDW